MDETTVQNPTAYEKIVQTLLTTRLVHEGLSDLKSFHKKRYRGKSGQEHEIDVSFEITLAELNLLFLVECKAYKRKVGLDDIATFAYRMSDIGAHKGLLVTTVGFQAGAERIARAERIALLIAMKGSLYPVCGSICVWCELWIDKLVLNVISDDNPSVSLVGERLVVGNEQGTLRPLISDDWGCECIAFLSPHDMDFDLGAPTPESARLYANNWRELRHGSIPRGETLI